MKPKIASLVTGSLPGELISGLAEADITYFENHQMLLLKLHRRSFDLLIIETESQLGMSLYRFVERYSIPVVVNGSLPGPIPLAGVLTPQQLKSLKGDGLGLLIETYKERRRLQRMRSKLGLLQRFEKAVPVIQIDEFALRLKSFLLEEFSMDSCFLLQLDSIPAEVPLILASIQALEASKLDQKDLVKQFQSYKSQVLQKGFYEVWQDGAGHSLALIDLGDEHSRGPCLILNGLTKSATLRLSSVLNQMVGLIRSRWRLCREVESYREQVFVDGLTGLHNQKYLYEVINKKIEEYHRYKTPFSVLFIDVDFFKLINDDKGHLVGSEVLRQLGQLIHQTVRSTDYSFRYGGDEFIVLLSHTVGDLAQMVAERLRSKIEKNLFQVAGLPVHITVSIGLAFFPDHATSAEEIIRIADEAMYYGKNQSRNIVYKAS